MYLGPFEIFLWLVLISCIFCVVITQNISRWFFLAPARVKHYNIVYTTYWLAAAGENICILGHAKCYLDSYGANIKVFTLPGLIHMESMESTPHFMESIWNDFQVRSQPFAGSIVTLDSIWNGHGMINSIWNSGLFHME